MKTELLYDSATAILGIYLKETKMPTGKGICSRMFIAALFTSAKTWKRCKCPSMTEWKKKNVVCMSVYTMEHYLTIKKKEILPSAKHGWSLKAWSKSDRKGQILYNLSYIWNLKQTNKQTKNKLKTDFKVTQNSLVVARGEGWRLTQWVKVIERHKLLVIIK